MTHLPHPLPPTAAILDFSYNRLVRLGPGSFSDLPRLETLRLSRNHLAALGPEVFLNATHLRHLDLSSNRLRTLESHCFQGLWRLEELLLFNNRIGHVEGGTLNGLANLRKAYFSLNQLTDFPFFSIADHSHPFLTMLDLSSNRLVTLSWEDVKALPDSLQKGIYLHNNSLMCDCSMYGVFQRWDQHGYYSVKDFIDEVTCQIYGEARAPLRFLRKSNIFQNCSDQKAAPSTMVLMSHLLFYEGEKVRLDCHTSLKGSGISFSWLTPNQEYITSITSGSAANDSLGISLTRNGTLEIHSTKVNDSGVYVCTAQDYTTMLNDTRQVNVTVVRVLSDNFNTGYTTLLGCAVTLVLILLYLYLTPCRCRCCKQPPGIPPLGAPYDPAILSSIFTPSGSLRDPTKAGSNRRVAFMDASLDKQSSVVKTALPDQPVLQWEWDSAELA